MRVPEAIGIGAVRFSLGRATTETEIDLVLKRLREAG
jgi:cysteine desulfurase